VSECPFKLGDRVRVVRTVERAKPGDKGIVTKIETVDDTLLVRVNLKVPKKQKPVRAYFRTNQLKLIDRWKQKI